MDRAQKEEKMEGGLTKLEDTWSKVAFNFAPHKEGSDVALVKMAEEDFEVGGAISSAWVLEMQQGRRQIGKLNGCVCRCQCALTLPGHTITLLPLLVLHSFITVAPALLPRCWRTTRCWCRA